MNTAFMELAEYPRMTIESALRHVLSTVDPVGDAPGSPVNAATEEPGGGVLHASCNHDDRVDLHGGQGCRR